MKKIFKRLGIVAAVFAFASASFAQSGVKKAEEKYDTWAYNDAIDIYSQIESKGYNDITVLKQLGDSYFFNGKYEEAHRQYNDLFKLYDLKDIEDIYIFRYAQTLKSVGFDDKAKEYFEMYKQRLGSDAQIAKLNKNLTELEEQMTKNSGRYSGLVNLPINTEYSDYGAYVYQNLLYFTTNRDTGSFSKHIHTWTGNQFCKIYTAPVENDLAVEATKLSELSTSYLNESSPVISNDGKTMYFTRNNSVNGRRKYADDGNTLLKIYKATWNGTSWGNVEELPFNSDEFNTANPMLSPDGKYLYFVSDRVGGYGSSDIWRVMIASNGAYGAPENLGPLVNTEARETFPFVSGDNQLYFSSDGRYGFGGLDVFIAPLDENNQVKEVQNVGAPINTAYDDFAYYINSQTRKGYVSSNRPEGKGADDIYAFVEQTPIEFGCKQALKVLVVDEKQQPISEAAVTLFDQYNKQLANTTSITNEYNFNYDFTCGASYKVAVNKEEYNIKTVVVTLPEENGVTSRTIVLEAKPKPKPKPQVKKGDDLFKVLKLNPIYFDYDKDNIRPDAALELAKVVEVMKEYPKMRIDVRSHTDSRGSDAYNKKLSERRAKSTAKWIIANGIDASRVSYKGYGETQLVNKCKNGVKCSEEQHQENRRSQFIILEL